MEPALFTLLGTIATSLVALVAIKVANDREDRHRFTERKQTLYTNLWTAADKHRREVEAQVRWRQDLIAEKPGADADDGPPIGSSEPARLALKAVELVAPRGVVKAAHDLYQATTRLGAWFAWDGKGSPRGVPKAAWQRAIESWERAAGDFIAAARRDLAGE